MPFTPTHVLAVVPVAVVARGWLPFSALVIGSMVPDFPLFSPLSPSYDTTHSALGLFSACLPLGLAVFLVFHGVMKRPLLALMPARIQSRCASLSGTHFGRTLSGFIPISIAIVVGAASHVFWDSFTHRALWGTDHFPWLSNTALMVGGKPVPWFKVFQYGSTLVGLPCLAVLIARWLGRQPTASDVNPRLSPASRVVALVAAAVMTAAVTLLVWRRADLSASERLGLSLTRSGMLLMIATLAYCLVFYAIERRLRPPDGGEIARP